MMDHRVVDGMTFIRVLKQGKVLDAVPEPMRLGISRPWHMNTQFLLAWSNFSALHDVQVQSAYQQRLGLLGAP
jgi:hypothetical protein